MIVPHSPCVAISCSSLACRKNGRQHPFRFNKFFFRQKLLKKFIKILPQEKNFIIVHRTNCLYRRVFLYLFESIALFYFYLYRYIFCFVLVWELIRYTEEV
ncbi:MAG: hypothetical protein D3904_06655 [Candidatus Electrothrix sp. EH2]|nr:hypothetical protein [Candidatus Electrothrix sp. EH2]